jgi:hypothetical protein
VLVPELVKRPAATAGVEVSKILHRGLMLDFGISLYECLEHWIGDAVPNSREQRTEVVGRTRRSWRAGTKRREQKDQAPLWLSELK